MKWPGYDFTDNARQRCKQVDSLTPKNTGWILIDFSQYGDKPTMWAGGFVEMPPAVSVAPVQRPIVLHNIKLELGSGRFCTHVWFLEMWSLLDKYDTVTSEAEEEPDVVADMNRYPFVTELG